jgi:hypothetical protein
VGSKFYELYGEHISLKDLLITTILTTSLAMVGYHISPLIALVLKVREIVINVVPLVGGILGSVLGFVISLTLVKVKRYVKEV